MLLQESRGWQDAWITIAFRCPALCGALWPVFGSVGLKIAVPAADCSFPAASTSTWRCGRLPVAACDL